MARGEDTSRHPSRHVGKQRFYNAYPTNSDTSSPYPMGDTNPGPLFDTRKVYNRSPKAGGKRLENPTTSSSAWSTGGMENDDMIRKPDGGAEQPPNLDVLLGQDKPREKEND